ncbi:MAG TPA: YIP1 family protein [Vicinamibacterales bacterium]|nr:YIP1 family protein [Vicinamibacterales bacterium]
MSTVQTPRKNIFERVKGICVSPEAEWAVIDGESATTGSLLSGYVVPLVAIGAVANFIGNSFVGRSVPFTGTTIRISIGTGLAMAVLSVVLAVLGVVVCAYIIDGLAPAFAAQKSNIQAMKVAAYAPTPAWVAGIVQVAPALGLFVLLGALYALYLLYLGLPRLMKCPQDKAIGYTVVVVLCVIVVSIVAGAIPALFLGNSIASIQ